MALTVIDDWEFNVLGIYNFNKEGKLKVYYDWIVSNHDKVDGDILEAGVFQGKSLLATALLLKKLGSSKVVYGFDSFSGFPPIYDDNDDLGMFAELAKEGRISEEHLLAHDKLKKLRSFLKSEPVSVKTISSSSDFSNSNLSMLKKKADYLELDNIVLMDGDFNSTMLRDSLSGVRLMAGLLDCDLYKSYQVALPFVWNRLERKGMVYLDEYYSLKFAGARIACDEFFESKSEKPILATHEHNDFERWVAIKD